MIGRLPTSLVVEGEEYPINSDYRTILTIFTAYNDPELLPYEKTMVMLECLYKRIPQNIDEAVKQAVWFMDCGDKHEAKETKKILDWEQDEQMIFSAINKVAYREVRSEEYLHWWSFMGYFQEIGEGLFSTVINIRKKKNKCKKLEKYEQDFYRENKKLIDIQNKLSVEEQEEKRRVEALLR